MTTITVFERSKADYLRQEDKVVGILRNTQFQDYFRQWIDTTLGDLELEYAQCDHLLEELQDTVRADEGDYWTPRTVAQHCNLSISEKRLLRLKSQAPEHSSWPEIIRLKTTLQGLKSRTHSTPEQLQFLERVEEEFREVQFTAREIANIAYSLEVKLAGDIDVQTTLAEIAKKQQAAATMLPGIDEAENALEAALVNGNMALAEAISYKQLDMHEHLLSLVVQQYPILHRLHDDTEEYKRRRRWTIFRLANKDISCVIEGKLRIVEACLEDQRKISEQVANYENDDKYQRRRYELDVKASNEFLEENRDKQKAVWNRIMELYAELCSRQMDLEKCADERRIEIDRRLRVEEREAGRRSGHEAFLKQADAYSKLLTDTINNATRAACCARALNDYVLDGCDSITTRFDKQHLELDRMLHNLQATHFKRFCDYYLSSGRLMYRLQKRLHTTSASIDDCHAKLELASESLDPVAKKHAEERDLLLIKQNECKEDVMALKHRIARQEADAEALFRAFANRGVTCVHPRVILERINFDREEKVLDYREMRRPELSRWEQQLEDEQAAVASLSKELQVTQEAKLQLKQKTPRAPLGSSAATQQQYVRVKALLDRQVGPVTADSQPSPAKLLPVGSDISSRPVVFRGTSSAALRDAAADAITKLVEANNPPAKAPTTFPTLTPGAIVKALFTYRPQDTDELALEKGDTIVCVGPAEEEGWYFGVLNQKRGLFPLNYVTVVAD